MREVIALKKGIFGDILRAIDESLTHKTFILATTYALLTAADDVNKSDARSYIDKTHMDISVNVVRDFSPESF